MEGIADKTAAQPLRWLLAAGAVALLLQIELIFNRPANWDEFYHLTQTHAFVDGRLTEALQVFYARAFFWIALLPLDAIGQLRVARLAMLAFELFTTAAIYAMATRFTDRIPAAVAALAYLTAGYVFQHGFSFRADPIAAALLMGALWILLASRVSWFAIMAAALLVSLGVLTTIKVALYAPAFAGIAWLRWRSDPDPRRVLIRFAGFALASALLAALLCGLTILSLPETGEATAARTVSTSATQIFSEGLFPRWHYFLGALASAPIMALLVLTTPQEIVRANPDRDRRIALFGLLLPLASVALYRNAFPYFYAFILPPVLVAASVAAQALLKQVRPQILAIFLVLNAAIISYLTPRSVLGTQQQVIAAVHEVFPRPVAYFDFPGMIVDFPKANFFITTWGVKQYWQGEREPFAATMARETVPLLIVNQEMLARNQSADGPAWELLPADARALRQGFVQHWGPLWVAGHQFPARTRVGEFMIYAPGAYTLEGGAARIDGKLLRAGQTVTLTRASHHYERIGAGPRTLRWGKHLPRPSQPYAGDPVFADF